MLEQYQRALVTGGCGIIGNHLTDALLLLGKEVTVLDKCSIEAEANVPAGASLVRGDVRKLGEVKAAVQGIDLVFHLAANASGTRSILEPLFDFETNALGTVNVLVAAVEAKIRRIVHISSGAV